jgi:hypothetical protein
MKVRIKQELICRTLFTTMGLWWYKEQCRTSVKLTAHFVFWDRASCSLVGTKVPKGDAAS